MAAATGGEGAWGGGGESSSSSLSLLTRAGSCATRPTMAEPTGASGAAVNLTRTLVSAAPIDDSATLRPAGGDRAASLNVLLPLTVHTTCTGTSTVLPCGTTSFAARGFTRIGPGFVTAAAMLTNGRA